MKAYLIAESAWRVFFGNSRCITSCIGDDVTVKNADIHMWDTGPVFIDYGKTARFPLESALHIHKMKWGRV